MRNVSLLLLLAFSSLTACSTPMNDNNDRKSAPLPVAPMASGTELVVGFYNLENLFDTQDDPKTIDEEFLPGSDLNWTEQVYAKKLENMANAIAGIGGSGPDILGVTEIENAGVLDRLVKQQALQSHGYRYAHSESNDERGVDVALIYDPAKFEYKSHKAVDYQVPGEAGFLSRPILVVEGKINGMPVAIFVNHWSSRREGQEVTEVRRVAAANASVALMAELRKKEKNTAFILMGDFNDDPANHSIAQVLGAAISPQETVKGGLFNPMYALHDPERSGTLTYQGKWNLFDQIIISEAFLSGKEKVAYVENSVTIHSPEILQVGGEGRSKDMPRRSVFRGEFQENGYSDHFPVYIRLTTK